MLTLEDRLRRSTRSAVHLEMRDEYMRSDPRFTAWQHGVRNDPAESDPERRPWLRLVAGLVAQGVEVRRARTVSEPMSDYIRFEHHLTDPTMQAGEQVRWLPRRRASALALPGNDFWLFDDSSVVFHHFAGDEELAPDDEEFTDASAVVKLCADAFETVWALAVPHGDYRLA